MVRNCESKEMFTNYNFILHFLNKFYFIFYFQIETIKYNIVNYKFII